MKSPADVGSRVRDRRQGRGIGPESGVPVRPFKARSPRAHLMRIMTEVPCVQSTGKVRQNCFTSRAILPFSLDRGPLRLQRSVETDDICPRLRSRNVGTQVAIRLVMPIIDSSGIHNILVLDDEPACTDMLKEWLAPCPRYHVQTSNFPVDALAWLEVQSFDLLICDLSMPGMDGLDVAKKVKEIDPDLEIIILTGVPSYDAAIESLRVRIFDYVTKPMNPNAFLETVADALARRSLSQGLNRGLSRVRNMTRVQRALGGRLHGRRESACRALEVDSKTQLGLILSEITNQLLVLDSISQELNVSVASRMQASLSRIADNVDRVCEEILPED